MGHTLKSTNPRETGEILLSAVYLSIKEENCQLSLSVLGNFGGRKSCKGRKEVVAFFLNIEIYFGTQEAAEELPQ